MRPALALLGALALGVATGSCGGAGGNAPLTHASTSPAAASTAASTSTRATTTSTSPSEPSTSTDTTATDTSSAGDDSSTDTTPAGSGDPIERDLSTKLLNAASRATNSSDPGTVTNISCNLEKDGITYFCFAKLNLNAGRSYEFAVTGHDCSDTTCSWKVKSAVPVSSSPGTGTSSGSTGAAPPAYGSGAADVTPPEDPGAYYWDNHTIDPSCQIGCGTGSGDAGGY